MSHPWELTLGQFIARVQRDYGMKLRHSETTWTDESGRSVTFSYLEAENSEAPFVLLPANLEPEDLLSLELLHNLVNRCGLPPDDFHLDREASLD